MDFWLLVAEYHLARSLMLAGRFDDARALLDEVHTAWSANATGNRDRLADLYRTQAELQWLQGNVAEARSSIDKSLAEFGYPQAAPAPFLSAALTAAAQIYAKGGQLDEAESFAAAALRLSESIARDPRQSADVGEALLVLGSLKNARGDKTTAADYARRSVDALTNSLGQQHRLTQRRCGVIEARAMRRGSAR